MWWRKRREDDLDRELRAHLDLEAEEGGDAAAARRALGNIGSIKEEVRMTWGWTWLETLGQDLRYSLRVLLQNPGFTTVAVLSLALGIGANTALFSLIDAAMLKMLPVRDPQQLRILTWVRDQEDNPKAPIHSHSGYGMRDGDGAPLSGSFAYPAYVQLRDHLPQFSDLVAYATSQFTFTARGASEFANGQFVSGNYFNGLGAVPILGRAIVTDDDAPGKPPVVVLSYRYWQKRFGADPSILNQAVSINQRTATVVGVMPPLFQGLYPGAEVDVFVPMSAVAAGERYYSLSDPFNWWVQVFGRLRPGVSDSAATQAVHASLAAFIPSYADSGTLVPEVRLKPGAHGAGFFAANGLSRLYVLDVIVGVVLLIACVNLAHLLLARSAARGLEMAVRLSVGASRSRLVRQLLTENIVLAGTGGALGLIFAKPMLGLAQQMAFGARPTTLDARLDARAMLFTFAVSVGTAIVAGLMPALRSTRVDLGPSLKGVHATGASSRKYVSRVLVTAQVGLSALLLIGAGLFVHTLERLISVDLGFNTGNVLTFRTDATRSGYKGQRLADVYGRVRERLEAIPGVTSVGLSQNGLLQGVVSNSSVTISGHTPASGRGFGVLWLECSDSFLPTMRIPVVLGRGLAPSDRPGAPLVAVVNETFVKRYLPGENPIGRRMVERYMGTLQIVGVAKDAHYESVRDLRPVAYIPYSQHLEGFFAVTQATFAMRTVLPPLSLAQTVRRAVSEIDPAIPVAEMRTMEDQIELSTGTEHLMAQLVSAFGLAAALLAAIGLYGVMAYTVARRTSEIGIRMALGANGGSVAWLVVGESVWMVAAGLAIGIPAALALSKFVRSMLYGITPNDPWSFTAAIFLMATVGAAAAWIPARRASRIDPMAALRNE